MKLNLGCGKRHMPREYGWVNVDRSSKVGADEVVDIFQYPWHWDANTVDAVYASHIIEHIPHEPKMNPLVEVNSVMRARWQEIEDYDGWYCFFGELWRVCKPNARIQIVAPFGFTYGAFQDPTHTRFLVPQSFAYLTAEMVGGEDFDYNIPCLYRVDSCQFDMPKDYQGGMDKFGEDLPHTWNLTRNMYVELTVLK